MSFTISSEKDEDLELLQITDCTTGIQIRIIPAFGALLNEFSIPLGNRRIQVISGYKNLSDLRTNQFSFYKSAKLSPFVCRISGGQYEFGGRSYEFKNKFNDGNAIHGLISAKPFRVAEKSIDEHEASVTFLYEYLSDDPGYPFQYTIQIRYTLNNKGSLVLATEVINNSVGSIPLADGWHPYFSLEGKTNDWLLSFRSKQQVAFNEKLIPLGHTIENDAFYIPRKIDSTFFDNCFLLEDDDGKAAATLENPANKLRLCFFPDKSYPFLQIYTPDDRQSIAIENLSAAPDAFNNGMGLIILEPGSSQSFKVRYQLEFM